MKERALTLYRTVILYGIGIHSVATWQLTSLWGFFCSFVCYFVLFPLATLGFFNLNSCTLSLISIISSKLYLRMTTLEWVFFIILFFASDVTCLSARILFLRLNSNPILLHNRSGALRQFKLVDLVFFTNSSQISKLTHFILYCKVTLFTMNSNMFLTNWATIA